MMNWKKFIKTYNEWFSFPIALVLFFVTPHLYRLIDSEAGAFDYGVFHTAIFAIALLSLYSGVAWFMLLLKFPDLKRFLDDSAEKQIISGVPHQKQAGYFAFAVYFAYMFLLYLLTTIL